MNPNRVRDPDHRDKNITQQGLLSPNGVSNMNQNGSMFSGPVKRKRSYSLGLSGQQQTQTLNMIQSNHMVTVLQQQDATVPLKPTQVPCLNLPGRDKVAEAAKHAFSSTSSTHVNENKENIHHNLQNSQTGSSLYRVNVTPPEKCQASQNNNNHNSSINSINSAMSSALNHSTNTSKRNSVSVGDSGDPGMGSIGSQNGSSSGSCQTTQVTPDLNVTLSTPAVLKQDYYIIFSLNVENF